MTLSFAAPLIVGAALVCCGLFAAGWRREPAMALNSLPLLTAGSAVGLAGAGRFAGARVDGGTGQEFATLVIVVGLAAVILSAAWARGGTTR